MTKRQRRRLRGKLKQQGWRINPAWVAAPYRSVIFEFFADRFVTTVHTEPSPKLNKEGIIIWKQKNIG